MAQIHKLFELMVTHKSSDLHLSAGSPPCIRVNGKIQQVKHPALSSQQVQTLVFEILNEKQKRLFVQNWELDCSTQVPNLGRFRCNVFMHQRGLGAVFRLIPEQIKSIEELGLNQNVYPMTKARSGLVLVTGPTGSGKSTTLAAMIHEINSQRQDHIITIEDPVEFVHQNINGLINQREVHSHTKSFSNALKSALREDPDVILVGEMRDLETIQLALTAAETGHLVFATLHTQSAAKTIDRIIDVFPGDQQPQIRALLAESLLGVVAQALVPSVDDQGRVPVLEILQNNNAVSNLIREGKTFQIPSIMQTSSSQGMVTFDNSLSALHREGLISEETLAEYSTRSKTKITTPRPNNNPAVAPVPAAGSGFRANQTQVNTPKPAATASTGIFKGFGKKSG